jgi:hypothetical protein
MYQQKHNFEDVDRFNCFRTGKKWQVSEHGDKPLGYIKLLLFKTSATTWMGGSVSIGQFLD